MNGLVTKEQVVSGTAPRWIKCVLVGTFGSGKTYDLGSFPKSLIGFFGSGEEDTIINRPELTKNLYGYKVFIPEDKVDTKRVMDEWVEFIAEARKLAKEGKIESVGIDTLNYLVDYRWMYINQYDKTVTKSGSLDTLNMYGKLSSWFKTEVKMQIMSLPCNVIINCHEKFEVEEGKDLEDMLPEAKKRVMENPIVPNIIGSARNEVGGMASYMLFKEKIQESQAGKSVYRYMVRTNKGGGKNAKSRLALPEVIDVTGKELYTVLKNEISKAITTTNQSSK